MLRNRPIAVFLISLTSTWCYGEDRRTFDGPYHIERVPLRKVSATFSLSRFATNEQVKEWVAFASVAPNLAQQLGVRSSISVASFSGFRLTPTRVQLTNELSPQHRPIFVARVLPQNLGQNKFITVNVTHEAAMYSRRLVPGPPTNRIAALSRADEAMYLAPSKRVDFRHPRFVEWLSKSQLWRKPEESALSFAYRVYVFLRTDFTYKHPSPDDELSAMCWKHTGSCGHYSMVFVGALRANKIPARSLVGNWVGTKNHVYQDGAPHVKSEFFVNGIGWIPVDASAGQTLGQFFGFEDGDFFTFHTDFGPDFELPTPHWGIQLQGHMQGIYLPALGGTWAGPKWRTEWRVSMTDLRK